MVATTSCMKEEAQEASIEEIVATTELPEMVDGWEGTRTEIYDTETGGIELWWAPKESIGVYGSGLKNVKFTSNNKNKDAVSASFSGGSLFSSPKYAYYPYSASNSSNAQTSVKGNLPISQSFSTVERRLNYDYKIGKVSSRTWTAANFTFSNLVTFVRPRVDATGTVLEGDNIHYIRMEVTSPSGEPRQIVGDFTFDITGTADDAIKSWDYAENTHIASLSFIDAPVLKANQITEGFLTLGPNVKKGDIINFTIKTDKHYARFSRTSGLDYTPNKLVKYTITLASIDGLEIEDIVIEQPEDPVDPEEPTVDVSMCKINNLKFTVANNPGKILARNFTHNSSFTLTVGKDKTEEVATIDTVNKKVVLKVPYLNNRKLVPTFEIPEGTQLWCEAGEIISGETEVDFSVYKQLAVLNSAGDGVIYNVEFTNSGLPVVVINQNTDVTSTETNSKYTKASNAWYKATNTKWVPKDADWPDMNENDNFIVYNADGTIAVTNKSGETVSAPIASATRIRGNVTQQMPKKSFAVKLDKKSGVLDMPAHKRWVLLANWKDRTLMRNAVANGIAKVFRDNLSGGMPWNPSGRYVELVYNGVHVGTYYLCEQIKIDENRLDINEPYDAEENAVAPEYCGILLESDDGYDEAYQFTTANYVPFLFKDDATDAMVTYASNFVRGIEDKLYAGNYDEAFKSMDLTSFVDFWLIQELMMNSETAHPKSCYSYINDGVMYAGPLWDFDWNTLPTSSSYSENSYSYTESMLKHAVASKSWLGTSYKCYHKKSGYPVEPLNESDANYIWYPMLVKSDAFKNMAAERWNAVKDAVLAYVNNEIPKIQAEIAASEALNNQMWPIDSGSSSWNSQRYSTYNIGGGFCGDEGKDLSGAVSAMQSTLKTRINGMNGYVIKKDWPSVSYGSK